MSIIYVALINGFLFTLAMLLLIFALPEEYRELIIGHHIVLLVIHWGFFSLSLPFIRGEIILSWIAFFLMFGISLEVIRRRTSYRKMHFLPEFRVVRYQEDKAL